MKAEYAWEKRKKLWLFFGIDIIISKIMNKFVAWNKYKNKHYYYWLTYMHVYKK